MTVRGSSEFCGVIAQGYLFFGGQNSANQAGFQNRWSPSAWGVYFAEYREIGPTSTRSVREGRPGSVGYETATLAARVDGIRS
jgi:hypothetical protein